jgi:hypothetical protein
VHITYRLGDVSDVGNSAIAPAVRQLIEGDALCCFLHTCDLYTPSEATGLLTLRYTLRYEANAWDIELIDECFDLDDNNGNWFSQWEDVAMLDL